MDKVETGEMETLVRKHLAEREPFYLQADHVIEAHNVEPEFIMKLIPELPRLL